MPPLSYFIAESFPFGFPLGAEREQVFGRATQAPIGVDLKAKRDERGEKEEDEQQPTVVRRNEHWNGDEEDVEKRDSQPEREG